MDLNKKSCICLLALIVLAGCANDDSTDGFSSIYGRERGFLSLFAPR